MPGRHVAGCLREGISLVFSTKAHTVQSGVSYLRTIHTYPHTSTVFLPFSQCNATLIPRKRRKVPSHFQKNVRTRAWQKTTNEEAAESGSLANHMSRIGKCVRVVCVSFIFFSFFRADLLERGNSEVQTGPVVCLVRLRSGAERADGEVGAERQTQHNTMGPRE